MSEDSQNVSYVYGFTRAGGAGMQNADGAGVLSGGIDEMHLPVFSRSGEVAAIVSQVSRSEFCGLTGETNLQDLTWLAARACRHQAVLEQVMRLGPVLPARFGTLFSSPASLEGFMRKHQAAMVQFLEWVGGQEESVRGTRADGFVARRRLFAGTRPAHSGQASTGRPSCEGVRRPLKRVETTGFGNCSAADCGARNPGRGAGDGTELGVASADGGSG
ncbi:MAG: GvpL/GvpF family gas vesicle protein [Verrucomicrobia bacterium]|nr:GvpL/GvpF family gas vesicle protein [Verrucomicrobiota bacterium]